MTDPLWQEHSRFNADEGHPIYVEFRDPEGEYVASVKWSGCIDFYRFHNVMVQPHEERGNFSTKHPRLIDYIHYCDIDHEIARLQALKQAAQQAFGSDWPDL